MRSLLANDSKTVIFDSQPDENLSVAEISPCEETRGVGPPKFRVGKECIYQWVLAK
jgi:hypothetical protein